MAQPTQLNPTEQDSLVKQIGLALLRAAPPDWDQIVIDYRAMGRFQESDGQLTIDSGDARPWRLSPDITSLFAKLRAGMYREGRGTWFNARYQLDRPTSYNLEYDRDEPDWEQPPPPQAYPDELRMFPRDDENVPEWLVRRMATTVPDRPNPDRPNPDRPGPRFRVARPFDGIGASGRPVVNRPPVDDDDRESLLEYLDRAPVVVPGRGFEIDRLDTEARQSVPIAFHSDGTWIWPAAVNHYLRKYRVPPESELVAHIRSLDFAVPEVDQQTRVAAAGVVDRGAPPRQGPPPGANRPPAPPAPPVPAAPRPAGPGPGRPPAVALPSQSGPGPVIGQLTAKLAEHGVPESVVRIGPPAENTWTMEHTDDGWRVGFFQHEFVAPAMFADVADASAFLLGKVLLDAGWQQQPRTPAPTEQTAPAEPVAAVAGLDPDEHHDDPDLGPDLGSAASDMPEPLAAPELRDDASDGFQHDAFRADAFGADAFRAEPDEHLDHTDTAADEPEPTPPGLRPQTFQPEERFVPYPEPASDPFEPESTQVYHPDLDDDHDDHDAVEQDVAHHPVAVDAGAPADVHDGDSASADNADELAGADQAEAGEQLRTQAFQPVGQYEPADGGRTDEFTVQDLPEQIVDDGPAVIEPDPLTLAGKVDEPELLTHGGERNESELESTQLHSPFLDDEDDDEDETLAVAAIDRADRPEPVPAFRGSGAQVGAVESAESAGADSAAPVEPPLPQRADPHAADPRQSDLGGGGLFTPAVPVDAVAPTSRALPERPPREPAELFTPSAPVNGRRVDEVQATEPALEPVAPQAEPPAKPAAQGWPIRPMDGEPPLTLFRSKEMRELPVGTEIDRYGDLDGNLTYVVSTPFEQRSLVPDWVRRPYHAYRVQRPFTALHGVAIPWFNQPGGGTAYMLPHSVGDLLDDGYLAEVANAAPPSAR